MKKDALLLFTLILSLVGCASALDKIGSWFDTSNSSARIITKGVVAEYLGSNKNSVEAIYTVSRDTLIFIDSSESVTVDQLETYVIARIDPYLVKMTPQGRIAMKELMSLLKTNLVKQLPRTGTGTDITKYKLILPVFFQWINDTAAEFKK